MPITFVSAGTVALNDAAATTLNVPYPSGIQAGDVIAMPIGVNSATLPAIPSDWLAGGVSSTSGGSAPAERIILKVCTGTETGSVAVTTPSATSRGQMLLFRGVDNATPIDNAGSTTASATATASYSLPSMTTTLPGVAIVLVGVANAPGGTWTSPTSPGAFTETAETTGAIPSTGIQYLIWSGSGATGTVTYGRSTSVRGCTGMLALRPAVTSTPPGQSSGSGIFQFVGTGSGAATRRAPGSSVFTFAGSGAGRTTRRASGGGSWVFAGTGAGKTSKRSGGGGTFAFAGTGTGRRSARSSSSGTFTFVGAGAGVRPAVGVRQGTGTGTWAFAGNGTGKTVRRSVGTSVFTFLGSGRGSIDRNSSGPGATTWTGSGAGWTYAPPTEFHGRILATALVLPRAGAEMVIKNATGRLAATSARARPNIPTATGDIA